MKNEDAAVSYYPSDWSHKNIKKATFPPGTYYIGDLCYALDEDLYGRVFGQDYDSGHYSQKNNPNHVFMLSDTGIGDGAYRGTDGHEYCVDAGILGIASESVLDPEKAPYDGGKVYSIVIIILIKISLSIFVKMKRNMVKIQNRLLKDRTLFLIS
jgi:hypothetical protein